MAPQDSDSDQENAVVTSRQAFLAMTDYIWRFSLVAGDDLVTLLSDTEIEEDGRPSDPAAWDDWLASVARIKAGRSPRDGS